MAAQTQASSSSTGAQSGSGGGAWSWIGSAIQSVAGVGTSALNYDLANRQYKYNLMAPLPVESQTKNVMLLVGLAALMLVLVVVIYGSKNNG